MDQFETSTSKNWLMGNTYASTNYKPGDYVPGMDSVTGKAARVVKADANTVTLGNSDGTTTTYEVGSKGYIVPSSGKNSVFNADGSLHAEGVRATMIKDGALRASDISIDDISGSNLLVTDKGTYRQIGDGSYVKIKSGGTGEGGVYDHWTEAGNKLGGNTQGFDNWRTTSFEDGKVLAVGTKNVDGVSQTRVQTMAKDGTVASTATLTENNGVKSLSYQGTGEQPFTKTVGDTIAPWEVDNARKAGFDIQTDENGKILDIKATDETQTATEAKPSELLSEQQKGEAEKAAGDSKDKAKEAAIPVDTVNETNAIQYAVLILQAIEGMNQEDATREVTVKGAQPLQQSQGSPTGTGIVPDTSLDGSTLSCAANSLATLLRDNPVNISLMNTDDLDPTKSADQITIRNRRSLLLQQYALSATIIAAGSNAISSQFYVRIGQLTGGMGEAGRISGTSGTLGSMSVLNDSERYPYFELVRQVALSGVQLGLKGASTLGHLDVISNTQENAGD